MGKKTRASTGVDMQQGGRPAKKLKAVMKGPKKRRVNFRKTASEQEDSNDISGDGQSGVDEDVESDVNTARNVAMVANDDDEPCVNQKDEIIEQPEVPSPGGKDLKVNITGDQELACKDTSCSEKNPENFISTEEIQRQPIKAERDSGDNSQSNVSNTPRFSMCSGNGVLESNVISDLSTTAREIEPAATRSDTGLLEVKEKSELARLESMLHGLMTSVETLNTKVDKVYEMLNRSHDQQPNSNDLSTRDPCESAMTDADEVKDRTFSCEYDELSSSVPAYDDDPCKSLNKSAVPDDAGYTEDACEGESAEYDEEGTAKAKSEESEASSPAPSHNHDDSTEEVEPMECLDAPATEKDNMDDEDSELVLIGGDPNVTLTLGEYKQVAKTRVPVVYAIELAEKLLGSDTLEKSTLTGENGTPRLDHDVLMAIKAEVIARFADSKPSYEKERLWVNCQNNISSRCKNLRYRRTLTKRLTEYQKQNTVNDENSPNSSDSDDHYDVISMETSDSPAADDVNETRKDNTQVVIGGDPNITMDFKVYQGISQIIHPNLFAICLAEKLFGTELLKSSTLTGKRSTNKLDENVVIAIKTEVLERFASNMPVREQERLWLTCQLGIANKCKGLRFRDKNKTLPSSKRVVGPTQSTQPKVSSEQSFGVSQENEKSAVREELDYVVIGGDPNIRMALNEYNKISKKVHPNIFAICLAEKLFGTNLMQSSTLTGKHCTNKLDENVVIAIRTEVLERFASNKTQQELVQLWITCQQGIANRCKSLRYKYKHKPVLTIPPPPKRIFRGVGPTQSTPRKASSEPSIGIDRYMDSEDFEDVMIGSDPNVTMSLSDYKEVTRLQQPSKYTIALAEKLFGRDILTRSTVTGKHCTARLDDEILSAIKTEIIERFAREKSLAEQEALWAASLLSIAAKCRTLRYWRGKALEILSGQQENPEQSRDVPSISASMDSEDCEEGYSIIIGGEPGVTLTDVQYTEVAAITQPNRFTLALAEKLFGIDTLTPGSVTDKQHTLRLDDTVLRAIKTEVLSRFAKQKTSEEQEKLWKDCFSSIAIKCRTLRYNMRMAHGSQDEHRGEVHRDSTGSNSTVENSLARSKVLDTSSSASAASRFLASEDRVIIGGDPGVSLPIFKYNSLCRSSHPNKYALALGEMLFGRETLSVSTVTGQRGTDRLDERLLTAMKADVMRHFAVDYSVAEQEELWVSCIQSIAAKCKSLRYTKRQAERLSAELSAADIVEETGKEERSLLEATESVDTSRDTNRKKTNNLEVLVGGLPDVTLSLDEYRELAGELNPSKYALALTEKLFGTETLTESTVDGSNNTQTLDENILAAIKADVLGRFAADGTTEEQDVMWSTCLKSIAAKSRSLRYWKGQTIK